MLFRIPLLKPFYATTKYERSVLVNLKTVERIAIENNKLEFYYNRSIFRSPSCVIRFEDHKRAMEYYNEIHRKIENEEKKQVQSQIRWDQPSPDLWAMEEVESYQPQKIELK